MKLLASLLDRALVVNKIVLVLLDGNEVWVLVQLGVVHKVCHDLRGKEVSPKCDSLYNFFSRFHTFSFVRGEEGLKIRFLA